MKNSEEIWINDWDAYICAGKMVALLDEMK